MTSNQPTQESFPHTVRRFTHELSNHLAVIQGNLEMVRSPETDQKSVPELLGEIASAVERTAEILKELNRLARRAPGSDWPVQ